MKYSTAGIQTAWDHMVDRPTIERGVDALLQELRGLCSADIPTYDEEDICAAWKRLRRVGLPINADALVKELAHPTEPEIANNLPVIDEGGYIWSHRDSARDCHVHGKLEVLVPESKIYELLKEAAEHMVYPSPDVQNFRAHFAFLLRTYKREGK